MQAEARNQGSPEQRGFRRFLDWLDQGADSGGEKYLEMRQRLCAYFERKNCIPADDLADDTLSRVARRLEEEGAINGATPAQYCYIVARFVFLEYRRGARRVEIELCELPGGPIQTDDSAVTRTMHLDCLERCLGQLQQDQRELILAYYQGERRAKIDQRRTLADRLGLTPNAVSIRACRIRDRLESCVKGCTRVRGSA